MQNKVTWRGRCRSRPNNLVNPTPDHCGFGPPSARKTYKCKLDSGLGRLGGAQQPVHGKMQIDLFSGVMQWGIGEIYEPCWTSIHSEAKRLSPRMRAGAGAKMRKISNSPLGKASPKRGGGAGDGRLDDNAGRACWMSSSRNDGSEHQHHQKKENQRNAKLCFQQLCTFQTRKSKGEALQVQSELACLQVPRCTSPLSTETSIVSNCK